MRSLRLSHPICEQPHSISTSVTAEIPCKRHSLHCIFLCISYLRKEENSERRTRHMASSEAGTGVTEAASAHTSHNSWNIIKIIAFCSYNFNNAVRLVERYAAGNYTVHILRGWWASADSAPATASQLGRDKEPFPLKLNYCDYRILVSLITINPLNSNR